MKTCDGDEHFKRHKIIHKQFQLLPQLDLNQLPIVMCKALNLSNKIFRQSKACLLMREKEPLLSVWTVS